MHDANTLYQQGQFDKAERQLREVIKTTSDDATALDLLANISLWKNSLTEAQYYFDEADKHHSWFARHWPMHTQRRVRQAITASRMNRYDLATQYLKQAAGPLAIGSFKELKVRAAQAALFTKQGAYRIEGDSVAQLEFVVADPLPVVKFSVNGSAVVNFFIDTGGEMLYFDRGFASEIDAQVVGDVMAEYAGAKKGATSYGKVDTVSLGGMIIHDVPIGILDLKLTSKHVFKGLEITGIVGTGFLMQFLTTIDYPNKRLVLRKPGSDAAKAFRHQLNTNNVLETPIWLVETHLIIARGSFNRQAEQLFLIDTGLADAGFHSSRPILEQAGVQIDWSKAKQGVGGGGIVKGVNVTIDQVTLGSGDNTYKKNNVTGVAMENDISLFNEVLGFQISGLISHEFFQEQALTFDFQNMHLIMH